MPPCNFKIPKLLFNSDFDNIQKINYKSGFFTVLKIFTIILVPFVALWANLFTITDKKGQVVYEKKLSHAPNEFLTQKATEYSFQAMYDELHRAENLARRAAAAKSRVAYIAKETSKAKKVGKSYKLTNDDKKKLLDYAKFFKGGKYVWGGTTPKGFDCSGYVQFLYKKSGINLPRTAWSQSKRGMPISKNHLKEGDLLFFLTDYFASSMRSLVLDVLPFYPL